MAEQETLNPAALQPALARIASGGTLDQAEAEAAFATVLAGRATPAQVAALAMGLRLRGETVAELTGAVRAMRAQMRPVPGLADAIDVCGTGGDAHGTLNVSTAVAFVLAALGVPVAKHGNRAMSSRAGASDTLGALGLRLDDDPGHLQHTLRRHGVAFLSAPLHHPGLRHASAVRAELGFRTVFNLLGPLCNPAGVRRQMIGVFDPAWQAPIARTLARLGSDRVWVVHGEDVLGGARDGLPARAEARDGLDELGLCGPNQVVALDRGRLARFRFEPTDLGLTAHPVSAIRGGDAAFNAAALERLLSGEPGPYRDTVLLNASAALQVDGCRRISSLGTRDPADGPGQGSEEIEDVAVPTEELRDGIGHAARALDGGAALAVLTALRRHAAAGHGDR